MSYSNTKNGIFEQFEKQNQQVNVANQSQLVIQKVESKRYQIKNQKKVVFKCYKTNNI